jgi:hypothetical protein
LRTRKRRDETGPEKEMRTLYIEGLASHDGPEPCVGCPRGRRRSVGRGTRRRGDGAAKLMQFGVPTPWVHAEGNTAGSVMRELPADPARSKKLCMRGVSGRENREISWPPAGVVAGRAVQGRPRSYA